MVIAAKQTSAETHDVAAGPARADQLAHVAHFYNAAAATSDAALARKAGREARFYERLMLEDGFIEAEIRRVKLTNHITWARRFASTIFFIAWLAGGVAGRFSSTVEQFGWAIMATSSVLCR